MIPVTAIRAATLRAVTGPAILLPTGQYDQTFLITAAELPMAVFLDGQHQHHAFCLNEAGNWKGASIGPVRFEVDKDSIYSIAASGYRLGTIIIQGEACFIVGRVKDGGWTDTKCIPLLGGTETLSRAAAEEVGFSKWRAAFRDGENWVTAFEFSDDQA